MVGSTIDAHLASPSEAFGMHLSCIGINQS
jgi:hypothetical protein